MFSIITRPLTAPAAVVYVALLYLPQSRESNKYLC